ncbi:MAG: AEC family transporter [Paracoccaceae bacterium]
MVQALVEVILPVFLVMGFGYLAALTKGISEPAIDGLMRFAQNFAVPCVLFTGVARLDLSRAMAPDLYLSFYSGAFGAFLVGALGARLIFRRPGPDSVAIGFCCLFSNSLLLGLPITERAYGTGALGPNYAIIAIHAPILYTVGITVMEFTRMGGKGFAPLQILRQILRSIATNPLVIGIALGFAVNLGNLALPEPVWAAVGLMSRAGIPAALFGLGGLLVRYRIDGDLRLVSMVVGCSLILHPAIAWTLGKYVFGLSVGELRSAVLTASMAPGINAYLFANIYGVGKRVAASAVLIGTALSILTIWGWLHILP